MSKKARFKPKAIGRYLVISSGDVNDALEGIPEKYVDFEGTFDTLEEVRNFIEADARSNFDFGGMDEGRDEKWGEAYYVAKIVDVLRPVPTVSVRIAVEKAKPCEKHNDASTGDGNEPSVG